MIDVASPPSAAALLRQMLWPMAMALSAFLAFGALLLSSADARPGEPGVLIFPPTWDQGTVMQATLSINAPLIDTGPAGFVVSVFLKDHDTILAAYEAGAVVVLNSRIASLCGAGKPSRKQGS